MCNVLGFDDSAFFCCGAVRAIPHHDSPAEKIADKITVFNVKYHVFGISLDALVL